MIVVTAASGQFGRLVIENLLKREVAAASIRAVVRTPEKVADFAARGVEVVHGDYTKPDTLVPAFTGADKLLLISSMGSTEDRLAQHGNAVAAAKEAGVGQIVYTSIPEAQTNPIALAIVHKATEEAITATGLPAVFLRNNWYFENTTANLGPALEHGQLLGAAGDGRIAYATRADYAEAAAVVLTTDGHAGTVYELTGDTAITQAELAAEVSRQSGKPLRYMSVPEADYATALAGFGLPQFVAELLAQADARTAEGALAPTTDTLRTLLGRPTTTLAEAVAQALG